MKHPLLVAEDRTVLGKKVKKLRREGLLPANVYGKGLDSHALQVKLSDFQAIFKEVGETGLVDLQFDGKTKPVLVKNLQMNFRSNTPLHVDFYQVNLKEKIKTMIPVVLTGEAKAVTDKVGQLLQTLSEVEIEALPDELPENIEVSVEHLAALEEQLTVGDLKTPEGVTLLTDPGQVIAKIAELVVEEEPEPEATTEEGANADKESGEDKAEEKKEDNSEDKAKEEK
jgi:large subunit ribosomal protein L25